jgi:formate dehydrogenase iron-sulfur subunit
MATQMAILQEIDKCMRCNGCVISCKRTWKMKGIVPANNLPHQKVDFNQRMVIKSQKRTDGGPFVRYSCWHCTNPPCAGHCPFGAITKDPEGGVFIDPVKCNPAQCAQQCRFDCQRGGYPKIGLGSDLYPTEKAWKCTLCVGRAGEFGDLPSKAKAPEIAACAAKAHQPSCVYTCPANAMKYDTKANIYAFLTDASQGWISVMGDGSMYWASRRFLVAAPKADPFVEDHLTPMVSSLLNNPFAKAALAPTLIVGGLLALAARRAKIAEEVSLAAGEAR